MVASDKRGLGQKLSPDTVWLLNRQTLADRWHTTPVVVEAWPAYERQVALKMLEIESEAEKRRPKPPPPRHPSRR
jgi:hypothetical protein